MDVMHIKVDEEHRAVKQFLHYLVKGTLITFKETAVAICTVIHRISSVVDASYNRSGKSIL